MQTPEVAYRDHVLARVTDYLTTEGISWTRRLWDVGSILALEELCEAGVWQPRKVIASTAMDWQRRELKRLVGPDLGMGDGKLRGELNKLLSAGELTDPSPGHRRLRELVDHARVGYLDRWAAALRAGAQVKPERLARTLASHLLDLGYTEHFLATSWASELRKARANVEDIVDAAAALARRPTQHYTALLALNTIPEHAAAERTNGWHSREQVIAWLKAQRFDASGLRPGGGFVYTVPARDPYGAADQVRQTYERMLARSAFIRKGRSGVSALPHVWIAGAADPLPLEKPTRSADVLSLARAGELYAVHGSRGLIDDALELAAPINHAGAPGPAVAGAWAAIESLLSHPGDPTRDDERSGKAIAADRMAAIVACSWPRAELTALVHRHKATGPGDELARRRDACATNRERAHVLCEEIAANGVANLRFGGPPRHSDLAAAERMRDCIAEPSRTIGEVSKAIQIALRRLYRARNLVLHGGSTSSVVLDAALRTAAPLVGAGLDRIAHHYFDSTMSPLDLAARAELAMTLIGGDTGLTLVDLLQKPTAC